MNSIYNITNEILEEGLNFYNLLNKLQFRSFQKILKSTTFVDIFDNYSFLLNNQDHNPSIKILVESTNRLNSNSTNSKKFKSFWNTSNFHIYKGQPIESAIFKRVFIPFFIQINFDTVTSL